MKTRLLTALIGTLLAGRAFAAPAAGFDLGAPKPADVIASAKEQPAPAIKVAGPVAVAPTKDAPAAVESEEGETSLRIVETQVADGKASVKRETVCHKDGGSTPCIDEKTKTPAELPADLADFDLKQTIAEAMASANTLGFRVAHDYQTRNNQSKFWCYGIWEDYGCKWVSRRINLGTGGINWESVYECAGKREVGHHCDCIENCN